VIEKGDLIVEVDSQRPRQCDQNRRDHADSATHVPPKERTGSIRRSQVAAPRATLSVLLQVSERRGWGFPKSQP
jgi:hypothetical protein